MNATTSSSSTRSPATRTLGWITLVGMAALALFGLVLSPADAVQDESVRMMYVHVPTALVAFTAFFVTVAGSIGYLVRRSEWWDLVAHASAELGAVLLAATLVSGALWGRVTWGVYWDWDPRLTTTALLFLLVLGYLAVRRLPVPRDQRSRWAAVTGLVLGPVTIICHYATSWWRSLHQEATISRLDPQIEGLMLFTLMLGMVVFAVAYVWLMFHRFRVLWLENRAEDHGLEAAIAARRDEAGTAAVSAGTATARRPGDRPDDERGEVVAP